MTTRSCAVAVLAAALLLPGCGYNIVSDSPKDVSRAEGKPLPLKLAVRDTAVEGAAQPSSEIADKFVAGLRQSNLFADVTRIASGQNPAGYDAVLQVSYKDTTDQRSLGFVFPPCLIPFVDLCIIPFGKVHIDIGAELNASLMDVDGQTIKSYAEKSSGSCQYVPFPGLFPFNLALIGPEVSCHNQEGPQAALQMALAKLVDDLVHDRSVIAGHRRAAPAEAESTPSETPASASGEKPWWK